MANVPSPKLVLAPEAVLEPVPPLATDKSVPDQLLLLILDAVASEPNPRFVLAPLAVDEPVPPLATAKSVPDQCELLTVVLNVIV